jgi:Ca-activated chloride channel homolog
MQKAAFVFISVFGFSLIVAAQSGRRIAPTPTPAPVAAPSEAETPFSESTPIKKPTSLYPASKTVRKPAAAAQPKADNETQTVSDAEDEVVKIETNLITIPVSVFDRNGLYIPNLSQEEFKIFEDGKEQEIAYFGTSEKPFTVVLLLDTSPSTEFKIDEIRSAAVAFVNQLKPQDQVMVIEFDANVHVLAEPTNDRQKIFKAINKADFGGGTSLYDAVDFSLRKRLNKIEGRKAIVLFTDGVDTTSYKSDYDRTLRDAEEADSMIFPIYYNTFFDTMRQSGGIGSPFPVRIGGTGSGDYALGRQYLKDLADSTGGRVFNAQNTPGGLTAAFEGIAEELRRQYSIGYYPQEPGRTGQRKQIKVRVNRPKLVIRARDSYIVGEKKAETRP